jgi:uncharacterized membrane protein
MSKILDKMGSPNLWITIASLLGVAGIALMFRGFFAGNDGLFRLGMWLLTPLLLGGIILIVVVIPILIRANRRDKKD